MINENCSFCKLPGSDVNPTVSAAAGSPESPGDPGGSDRLCICRRCIIDAALAMDPKGERIIVRVPSQEDMTFASAFRGTTPLKTDTVGAVLGALATWTNRARHELARDLRAQIADARKDISNAEMNIEDRIAKAQEVGIDLNMPEPVMPDGTAVAAPVEPGTDARDTEASGRPYDGGGPDPTRE